MCYPIRRFGTSRQVDEIPAFSVDQIVDGPKRHHYLPESYLARFTREQTRDGKLWVYDILRRQLREQSPNSTGAMKYFYSFTSATGYKDNSIENALSDIEGKAVGVIGRVEQRDTLSNDDRSVLAYFLALLRCRVPEFQTDVNKTAGFMMKKMVTMSFANEERAQASIDAYEKGTGGKLGVTAKEAMEYMSSDGYRIDIKRALSLQMMLKAAPKLAEDFHIMDWAFLHAPPDRAFITTDSPFHISAPPDFYKWPKWNRYGYRTAGTRKVMPLSGKTAVVMFDPGQRVEHREADEANVRWVNQCLALDAYGLLIGRDEALVRSLASHAIAKERRHGYKWGGSKLVISGEREPEQ